MSMMRQLYKDKARVAVYIRRVKDLRGVCIGTLIAFDKHFNLVRAPKLDFPTFKDG
jgi:small nuclear ribonucleoprotein (snRNP)-like protein